MMNFLHEKILVCTTVLFCITFAGCASTGPTKFYTLSSVEIQQQQKEGSSLSIEVGPVEIPDYLDRPHLVTRTGRNELIISDFNKWAGSLKDDIARVVSEDLSARLSTEHVYMYPWAQTSPVDYHVRIKINRFEKTEGNQVILKAYWSIYGEGGTTLLIQNASHIHEEAGGSTYAAAVAAMSRAMEKLSGEIADAIRTLSSH